MVTVAFGLLRIIIGRYQKFSILLIVIFAPRSTLKINVIIYFIAQ